MKKSMTLLLLGFSFVFSLTGLSAGKQKVPKYFTDAMVCLGSIHKKPKGMADSWLAVRMDFTSFKSTRRDGSLADSLQIKLTYAETVEAVTVWDGEQETLYTGPLRVEGKRVYVEAISGRDDDVELTITATKNEEGKQVDELKGTWSLPGTVVGDYSYKLECKALVVKKPHRVDDFRAKD